MSEASDLELQYVGELQSGNHSNFGEYLKICRGPLLAFILKNMSDQLRARVEAEDLFQEVCASAFQNVSEIDFAGKQPFGWLCELARRKIVDTQRRYSADKRAAHAEVGIFGGQGDQTGLVNMLVASITSPSAAFSRQQKEFRLLDAMEQLSAEQKQVLQLRYGQGLSSKEIATEIGKSDGATRVLLTRSLKKLEQLVRDADQPPEESNA